MYFGTDWQMEKCDVYKIVRPVATYDYAVTMNSRMGAITVVSLPVRRL
jgi:hypothetical protein